MCVACGFVTLQVDNGPATKPLTGRCAGVATPRVSCAASGTMRWSSVVSMSWGGGQQAGAGQRGSTNHTRAK